jgi:hypothetical protein
MERKQISVRVLPDDIESLEERALEETMRLGVNVTLSNLINRGIQLVLSTPLPGKPARPSICNLAPGVAGSTICLECRTKSGTRSLICPKTNQEVTRGS